MESEEASLPLPSSLSETILTFLSLLLSFHAGIVRSRPSSAPPCLFADLLPPSSSRTRRSTLLPMELSIEWSRGLSLSMEPVRPGFGREGTSLPPSSLMFSGTGEHGVGVGKKARRLPPSPSVSLESNPSSYMSTGVPRLRAGSRNSPGSFHHQLPFRLARSPALFLTLLSLLSLPTS